MPTKIEWATETWNPITGCSKISEACQNCYAERMSHRLAGRYGYPTAPNQFRPTIHWDRLEQPKAWKSPQIIFAVSMGDMFHREVAKGWLFHIFDIMAECKQHTFIVLTKRPENIKQFLYEGTPRYFGSGSFLENVWLGVTAENQQRANKRIPILLQIPAAVRFVSVEPMLGPVDLWDKVIPSMVHGVDVDPLDWVICGAETGPGARPMKSEWAVDLWKQCDRAGVSFFFKKETPGDPVPDYVRETRQFPK